MAAAPESPTPAPTGSSTSLLRTGLSRRGVVRTALWSVPAVTLATAAPAYAASTINQLTYDTASALLWDTLVDYPEPGATLRAAEGAIGFVTSSETVETPALRLTINFPSNWTAGGSTVFVAPDPRTPSWEALGWEHDGPLTNGRLSSTSGSFGFTYRGGEMTPFIGIPFIAWGEPTDLFGQDTPVTATLQVLDPTTPPAWEVVGLGFAVPVEVKIVTPPVG
ncbi:hypothetical protein IEQ44_09255 [Nocardioides sp. Y6]|uniref:Uncharacterized protein n=1 Tax=Nocardioides malaquae TaxID=2773426 RepID=A0ABR9RTH5_9ACTN|nr:hypothetical protein [Nocardioides malaquae]MBE7324841.1 hypothetical protein [Nocardioides malaquae]